MSSVHTSDDESLLGYWKFDEDAAIAIDSTPDPANITLSGLYADGTLWRYVDEPFPELAGYNQTSAGTFYGDKLPGLSMTRSPRSVGMLKLARLVLTSTSALTLEFYVLSMLMCLVQRAGKLPEGGVYERH